MFGFVGLRRLKPRMKLENPIVQWVIAQLIGPAEPTLSGGSERVISHRAAPSATIPFLT
jgi:hypothetical protein